MMIARLLAARSANSITGTDSPDILVGKSGANAMFGLGGADLLRGGAGDDMLDGGKGADVMYGGPGNDTYYVDNTADRTFEMADEGIDTVLTELNLYALKSQVENLTFTNGGAHFGRGNQLAT